MNGGSPSKNTQKCSKINYHTKNVIKWKIDRAHAALARMEHDLNNDDPELLLITNENLLNIYNDIKGKLNEQ